MKLFGSKRSSKHRAKGGAHNAGAYEQRNGMNQKRRGKKKPNVFLRVVLIVIAVIAVLAIAVFAYWKTAVKPPDVKLSKGYAVSDTANEKEPSQSDTARTGDKYTFLILGTDDGNGNTDTMMVATLDTTDYTLNVVSIPRDTLVNVSWSIKKVNSLYGVGGIDRVLSGVSELLGYEVDFYAIVDLEAFVKLVDAIGGVYYDVPQDMYYNDPAQDLYISIPAGTQYLDGSNAVKVVRYRAGYASGDIGRIDTQQDFLKTMAEQILENVDSISVTTLADVFLNNVETDLTYGNVIWFAKECLKMDSENITFQKLPGNYNDWINGSYVTIYVDEWLEMINTYLNPFDEPIVEADLNILTRNASGALYSTSGIYAGDPSWGSGSSSSASSPSSSSDYEPDPEPTADPDPEPTPDPEPDPTTDPNQEPDPEPITDPEPDPTPIEGDPEEGDPEENSQGLVSG